MPRKKAIHIDYSHFFDGGGTAYCGKRWKATEADTVVALTGSDVDRESLLALVTCKKCLDARTASLNWSATFRKKRDDYTKAGDTVPAHRAWLETTAELGASKHGFPTPKRNVFITKLRGADGLGRWEVSAGEGCRFIDPLIKPERGERPAHAIMFDKRDAVEKYRNEAVLEWCPSDCACKRA